MRPRQRSEDVSQLLNGKVCIRKVPRSVVVEPTKYHHNMVMSLDGLMFLYDLVCAFDSPRCVPNISRAKLARNVTTLVCVPYCASFSVPSQEHCSISQVRHYCESENDNENDKDNDNENDKNCVFFA